MLIYSQCKYLNCLMPYPYMRKQYDSVNEMHSIGNENCEHIIVLAYSGDCIYCTFQPHYSPS